ncbi:MAG: hypothetical protein N4A72_14945 [Bacteroidales bacterium]|jgi:hypothetical protein|nr:hypothetical protein [Bacteroidales bacterium]
MRKIKTLMAIFLSLFIMVILQSCEKETVEVTEPEQEHQEEIITADKLLEREGAMYLHLKRNWGTYYVTTEYTDIILADGYYIKDIYICSTRSRSMYERVSGCVLVPVDLNMGYWTYGKYNVFLALDIKRYKNGMSCVKSFFTTRYNIKPDDLYPIEGYQDCKYIPSDKWYVDKKKLSFDKELCNLNRGTNGEYVYLMYEKVYRTEGAVRTIRLVYDCKKSFNGSQMRDYGFSNYTFDLNYGNRSLTGVYLGWRNY